MISVQQARELLKEHSRPFGDEIISLYDAANRYSAEDILATMDMPMFDNAAMDGFALRYEDGIQNIPLYNEGEIKAGDTLVSAVDQGHCIRIFTGALIPLGVDTVVMQEHVEFDGKNISIPPDRIRKGANIRKAGSQTKQGEVLIHKGDLLTSSACGMLAGFGIDKVRVFKKPTIDILVTGNELTRPPEQIKPGKIYESNSFALSNVLKSMRLDDIRIRKAIDQEHDMMQKVSDGLRANVLIITGGVSVGKYDIVKSILNQNQVEAIFHFVNQKPGKPFYFGKKGDTLVFGLPGNPGSVMSCFYIYVRQALAWAMGANLDGQTKLKLKLLEPLTKRNEKTFFLKGCIKGDSVQLLDGQESYKMNAFAVADCLVEIPAEATELPIGSLVDVHLL